MLHKNISALLCAIIITANTCYAAFEKDSTETFYVQGRVLETEKYLPEGESAIQNIEVLILNGKYRNVKVNIENRIWPEEGYNTRLTKGSKTILRIKTINEKITKAHITGYERSYGFYFLIFFFLFAIFVSYGFKKSHIIVSVLVNISIILLILLPLIKKGYPPISSTLAAAFIGITISIYLILGKGKKTSISVFCAMVGVVFASVMVSIFMDLLNLTGKFMPDSRQIILASRYIKGWSITDLDGLIVAGVMVTCLGAVIDIAVTIVSAATQIVKVKPNIPNDELFNSSMSVGRDVIATMLNSLILAFAGISLTSMLIFTYLRIPMLKVINMDYFSLIIMSAVISSMSLVFIVPIAAFLSSRFLIENEN